MRSGCRECQRTLPAISSRMLRFTGSLVWAGTRSGVVGSMAEVSRDGNAQTDEAGPVHFITIFASKRLLGGIGFFGEGFIDPVWL
jgi:hypothetical protein